MIDLLGATLEPGRLCVLSEFGEDAKRRGLFRNLPGNCGLFVGLIKRTPELIVMRVRVRDGVADGIVTEHGTVRDEVWHRRYWRLGR